MSVLYDLAVDYFQTGLLIFARICAGYNLPGIASQFATQKPGFAIHCCVCVAKDV